MSRAAILDAMYTALVGVAAKSDRNSSLPAKVPVGGLLIMRDGEPGEPVTYLGRPQPLEHYMHGVDLEIYVQRPQGEAQVYALVDAIAASLADTAALGGMVERITIQAPVIEAINGETGDEILAASVRTTLDYVLPMMAA